MKLRVVLSELNSYLNPNYDKIYLIVIKQRDS